MVGLYKKFVNMYKENPIKQVENITLIVARHVINVLYLDSSTIFTCKDPANNKKLNIPCRNVSLNFIPTNIFLPIFKPNLFPITIISDNNNVIVVIPIDLGSFTNL